MIIAILKRKIMMIYITEYMIIFIFLTEVLEFFAKCPDRYCVHLIWTCFKSLIIGPMNLIFFVQVWEIG